MGSHRQEVGKKSVSAAFSAISGAEISRLNMILTPAQAATGAGILKTASARNGAIGQAIDVGLSDLIAGA